MLRVSARINLTIIIMKKLFLLTTIALSMGTSAFADDNTKQTVTINGSEVNKTVQTITFSGDNINLQFTDGSSQTVDLEELVIAFYEDPTAITVSSVNQNGEINKIYDTNGRQMRSSIESLPAGIYIIKSAEKTVKFIKK